MLEEEVFVCKISDLTKEEETRIPIVTFNQKLDKILNGGISVQKVTEIFGDKGIGKTTFCYQLALNVQIPKELSGLESQCIYIDTENSFAVKRVRTMATELSNHCKKMLPSLTLTVDSLLNGIHYIHCGSSHELLEILENLQEYIVAHPKVKLVVIDTLAFLFYSGTQQFHERGKILYKIFQSITQLQTRQKLAFIVTNNMTTKFSEAGTEYRIPFLGESWTHIPQIRLCLAVEGKTRIAKLVKGFGGMPEQSRNYRITSHGIRD